MLDTSVSIVRAVQKKGFKQDGNVPMGVVTLNREKMDALIDPRSRLNLMHERYTKRRGLVWRSVNRKGRMANDSVSNFLGYIPNVEVKAEGVRVVQGFYIMGSASFDVLLGMPWIAASRCDLKWRNNQYWCLITSSYKEVSFIATTVPESWMSRNEEDNELENDEEEENGVLSVRSVHMDWLEMINMEAKSDEILVKARNGHHLLMEEVEPIDEDQLAESRHKGRVIYWNINQKIKLEL